MDIENSAQRSQQRVGSGGAIEPQLPRHNVRDRYAVLVNDMDRGDVDHSGPFLQLEEQNKSRLDPDRGKTHIYFGSRLFWHSCCK